MIVGVVDDDACVVGVCGSFEVAVVNRCIRRIVHVGEGGKAEGVIVVEMLLMVIGALWYLVVVEVLVVLFLGTGAGTTVGSC